jgi:plastocyanin
MAQPCFAALILAIIVILPGCGGGGECCDPIVQDPTASKTGGDVQAGSVGEPLPEPLLVTVTTDGGAAPGVTVIWSTAAPGGTLTPTSAVTDANGVASSIWTLGTTPGTQTATATVAGATGSPVTFTATAAEPVPTPTAASVTVRDNNFLSVRNMTTNPAVDTVAVGGSVTWTWAPSAGAPHDVTSTGSPSFTSRGTVTPPPVPDPHQVSFPAAGTYNYYCTIHGSPTSGMRGRIVVK